MRDSSLGNFQPTHPTPTPSVHSREMKDYVPFLTRCRKEAKKSDTVLLIDWRLWGVSLSDFFSGPVDNSFGLVSPVLFNQTETRLFHLRLGPAVRIKEKGVDLSLVFWRHAR